MDEEQRPADEDEIQRAEIQNVGQRPAPEDEIRRAEAGQSAPSPSPRRRRRNWRFWRRKAE